MPWGVPSGGGVWEYVMMSEEELREEGLFGVRKMKRQDFVAVFRHWGGFREARAILGCAW